MNYSDIFLIILSSAGLLHGVLFAFYLLFFKKKKTITNTLLGFVLIFMAFRIGKSILLNFSHDLEPIFICIGLAFILLIGPFLRWYFKGMTTANFKLLKIHIPEIIPFVIVFGLSFLIAEYWLQPDNKVAIIIFGSVLIFSYLHFLVYIFLCYRILRKSKRSIDNSNYTKSQKSILNWLTLLIVSSLVIWVSYFLNIIENSVPYIIGPILYSIVIYFLTFKAFQLNITEVSGSAFKKNDDHALFERISNLVIKEELYLESDISLAKLSKLIGVTAQKTSEVINEYSIGNFNDFINYNRVQKAKEILSSEQGQNYTIASVAFDVGFNSLSSFNASFKKFEGITPSIFKKNSVL
ncbi:helix-turn-helix domain-containing protein [Tenacibaculum sp. 190524A05c]|uniref:Transcriptional regulator, AraC family n=1 Tax=Tenacibaculum platacis TaxID=3137852 RepID=A0ABP1ELJ3_9FLAO